MREFSIDIPVGIPSSQPLRSQPRSSKPVESGTAKRIGQNIVIIASGLTFMIASCSSAVLPQSSAELAVQKLAPEAGSDLGESSVLEVAFEYRIEDFHESAKYGIAPLFADKRGSNRTFTAQRHMSKVLPLAAPEGHAELRYPIHREWKSGHLVQPVEVWFVLVQETGSLTEVIARTGPFIFD